MYIKYSLVRETAHPPVRENTSDVGLDVFFSPEPPRAIYIMSGTSMVFPTGIKLEIPHGFCAEVKNRSSVSSKKNLLVGGGILDPGYSGEVSVILHNVGTVSQEILPGDKIAQIVIYPVVHAIPLQCSPEELYENDVAISDRKDNGFGSTGSNKKDVN